MGSFWLIIAIGLGAGAFSGLVGVGGGIIMVPAMVWLLGFEQHKAQGTSLAMLSLPFCAAAAWQYWRAGHTDLKVALLLGLGFVIGGVIGGHFAVAIPELWMKRIFGVVMLFMSVRMLIGH